MLYTIGAVVVALLVLVILFRTVWRVAEPNEALIISGLGAHGEASSDDSRGFKIVVGRGTAVIPGFQTVRRLPLGTKSTGLIVNAVSNQSIPLTVKGIVAFKVGDDQGSIRNAARRFLEQKDELMLSTIHELFAGHLRAIVGGMSVEDMLHNREELTANIRSSLADDLGKLGLVVDSLQIQEIDDESGYIANLGKPQAAAIESKARIAAAQRDQEATEAEQAADSAKAAAVRESSIAQSGYQAEVDRARSEAAQSGPLAEAQARQEVVRAETEAAMLDAARREKMLESEVRKPADAEAYRRRPGHRPRAGAARRLAGQGHRADRRRGGQGDRGQGAGRGGRHQGPRRRAGREPGRGDRADDRRAVPGDRPRRRLRAGQHRQPGGAQRRRGHGGPAGQGPDHGRRGPRAGPAADQHDQLRPPRARHPADHPAGHPVGDPGRPAAGAQQRRSGDLTIEVRGC
jgi:regulator of protease activity HflC (stomatin/prohibitin superfamily)